MNLPTISMDKAEARKSFLEYRAAVTRSLNREADTLDERKRETLERMRRVDEATMRGYRLLSLGRLVLDLERAIHEGGVNDLGQPRLAVSRADQERVSMQRWRDGSVQFESENRGNGANVGSRMQRNFRFRAGTLEAVATEAFPRAWGASAIVPTIPPHLRPDSLDQYHILWEAEWTAVAPKDPALLRALGGGLYAVVAVWDLTEIERVVLGIERRG